MRAQWRRSFVVKFELALFSLRNESESVAELILTPPHPTPGGQGAALGVCSAPERHETSQSYNRVKSLRILSTRDGTDWTHRGF